MIAIPPATCSQIESVQQIDQLRIVKLDAFRVVRSCQHLEGAAFEAFVENRQPVMIPEQDLDAITNAVEEHEQMS